MARRKHRKVYKPFKRASKPGTAAGTIKPESGALAPVIDLFVYDEYRLERLKDATIEQIQAMRGSARVLWVNIHGLGDAALIKRIGEMFDLHELALEDTVNVHQRAKVEEFDGFMFLVARMVERNSVSQDLETEQISMFVGRNFLITFQEQPGDCFNAVRNRLRGSDMRLRARGADFLAYTLLDSVVDAYFQPLERYGDSLERMELEFEASAAPDLMDKLHEMRSNLLMMRRAVWPLRDAVTGLLRDHHGLIEADTRLFLRDVYDHTVQLVDVIETYREICADLRELHYVQIGQKTNEVMKVLTIISTIFIPLSFITGLYGMNFDTSRSPYNMPELETRYGYFVVLGIMLTIASGLLVYFYRRGWLSRES